MANGDLILTRALTSGSLTLTINRFKDLDGHQRFVERGVTREMSANGTVAIFRPLYTQRYLWVISQAVLTVAQANTIEAMVARADTLWAAGEDGAITLEDWIRQIAEPVQSRKNISGTLTTAGGVSTYLAEFRVLISEVRRERFKKDPAGIFGANALELVSFVMSELQVVPPT